jgi:hypothetical protein
MAREGILLDSGKSLYLFSHDLVWGCRHYAKEAQQSQHVYGTFLANLSCILFGSSFLEARLNELSAELVAIGGAPNVPLAFWRTLHDMRKTLKAEDKWNLIASVSNGKLWDSSREPFQSYDQIINLRNDLVHYKGEYATLSTPPANKLKGLLTQFKGPGFSIPGGAPKWISQLLTAKKLGSWISATIDDLDMNFDHHLTGTEITEQEKDIYKLLNDARHDPFRMTT